MIVCWDTEIVFPQNQKPDIPEAGTIWDLWPFGISVVAEAWDDPYRVLTFADGASTPRGGPGRSMRPAYVMAYLTHLAYLVQGGAKVFAHNGAGFDWELLARITGEYKLCTELCLQSYDLCFQALCVLGYPVGLESIATYSGLAPKEMGGGDAPTEWYAGNYEAVREYVRGDVCRLMGVVKYLLKHGYLSWRTRKGGIRSLPFPHGPLTVEQCLNLPLPDTSWLDKPIRREDVLSWINPSS